eukprot:TRINITY_DN3998_c0_g1_i6.p1 TRINITY_DN3998_c0_g1~~TRINITY_DN3998_c0_g1_i6.p1  ORF type:complete len:231 (+),score=44.94 TRINITY_DN3998_c0_g1_i6:605-1297(+)
MIKGPEILNKYIGASEQAVRDIFERGLQNKPSIVFFDEFDAVVPKRNAGSTGVTDRIVNQFLCYLDGVSSLEGVYIIAATSRPDILDPAIIRPGRISQHVYCHLPTKEERINFFRTQVERVGLSEEKNQQLIEMLADETEYFSIADLTGVIQTTQLKALRRCLESGEISEKVLEENPDVKLNVSEDDFKAAIREFKGVKKPAEIKQMLRLYDNFRKGSPDDVSQQRMTLH